SSKFNSKKIEMSHTIKGLSLFSNIILSWNGTTAYIFEVNLTTFQLSKINSINIKSNLLALNEDSVIAANGKNIDVYSYEGELKNSITLDQHLGDIVIFNTVNKFLLVCTSNNYYGIYDITRRTLKQIMMFRK